MATFWARIPYRDIVSELDFFKNQITNYARVVSRRKSSFESFNFEEITPFRSLEDEYAVIGGLYSFVLSSVETASHRYLSASDLHEMIPLKFKPLKDDFLLDTRLGLFVIWFLKTSSSETMFWSGVLAQNVAMESSFVRFEETRWSRAPHSRAKPTYLLTLLLNSTTWRLWKWLKLEINPNFEAGKL